MSDIDEIKSRLDIVEVVSHYVPELKKTGRSYKARCPFHQEKTPSFIVTPDMQRFKCFGCGEGGDAISFIQKIERVDFPKALEIAAERVGYELKKSFSAKDESIKKEKQKILEVNKLATKFWNYVLKTHKAGKTGRDYLTKRKIRFEEVDKFQLGYAPKGNSLKAFLVSKGYQIPDLVAWGLLIDRDGKVIDKFRDRLMLPVCDTNGNPIGFSGRVIGPSDYAPKYLNSPETLVYRKGEILMGLYQAKEEARKKNFLILEEGNIDLLSSHKVGVFNISATGGTALTEQQCKLVKRFSDTVYFCFDTDAAGLKALLHGVELAERVGLKHKALQIGDYQDPDELISHEPEKWAQVVANPQNTISYLIQLYQKDVDLGTADGKSSLTERIVPVLRSLKDEVQKQHFADQVAMLVGVAKQAVLDKIDAAATRSYSVHEESREQIDREPKELQGHASPREVYLLALLTQIADIGKQEINAEVFSDVNCREVFTKLSRTRKADVDFGKLAEELSDGAAEVLQEVLMTDTATIVNPADELHRVYRTIYTNFLRRQVLDLRRSLQVDPSNEELLSKLKDFTRELNSIGKPKMGG